MMCVALSLADNNKVTSKRERQTERESEREKERANNDDGSQPSQCCPVADSDSIFRSVPRFALCTEITFQVLFVVMVVVVGITFETSVFACKKSQ